MNLVRHCIFDTCKQLALRSSSAGMRQWPKHSSSMRQSVIISSSQQFQTAAVSKKPQHFESPYEHVGGLKNKIKKKLGWLYLSKHELYESSVFMYEASTDHMPVELFFKEFGLPDTFYSWLLMARSMSEGPEGKFLRDQLVGRLWEDATERLKHLAKMPSKERKETLRELMEHFHACVLSYDEGLLGDDKTLTGAVWRIFFTYKCDDLILIEKLVAYIRAQHEHLMSMGTDALLLKGVDFKWKAFPPFHTFKPTYPKLR